MIFHHSLDFNVSYNYRKHYCQWEAWKRREEKELRQLGVDEKKIRDLRRYDWEQFKAE